MSEDQSGPASPPKKKVARCGQTCAYVVPGKEAQQCKSKCCKEPGHVVSCKCRTHELQ